MRKPDVYSSFRRLQNRYRLIIRNEDSFEEITSFSLGRVTVYIFICSIFIILTGFIITLLWFTPLKQFTPGYKQGYIADAKYKQLKMESDSVLKIVQKQTQYIVNIQQLLANRQERLPQDTALLKLELPDPGNELKQPHEK